MIHWLLQPENNALVTWIGFAVGVIGTLLGLLGIGLTLQQLKAIKTETEAASLAINSVQLRVASFDAAQECKKANENLLSIRYHFKSKEWDQVLKLYEDLIQNFLNLAHSTSSIDMEDRQLITKYTEDIAKFCEGIRRRLQENNTNIFLKGQDLALRNFADIVTKISFAVTRSLQQ